MIEYFLGKSVGGGHKRVGRTLVVVSVCLVEDEG